ncbi:hypothetical protein C8R46DRAFT_1042104 [Mycena filopes]|nr:hypothetical protein C8R46DRAFT_1042104 [Mycena filopes]
MARDSNPYDRSVGEENAYGYWQQVALDRAGGRGGLPGRSRIETTSSMNGNRTTPVLPTKHQSHASTRRGRGSILIWAQMHDTPTGYPNQQILGRDHLHLDPPNWNDSKHVHAKASYSKGEHIITFYFRLTTKLKNGASTHQSGVRLALARLCEPLTEATVADADVATDHGRRAVLPTQLDTVESSMAHTTSGVSTSFNVPPKASAQCRSDGERTTGHPPAAAPGDDTPTAPGRDRTESPDQRPHYLEGRLTALEYKLGLYPDPQASFEARLTVATDVLKSASSALPEVCISLLSADAAMAYWNIRVELVTRLPCIHIVQLLALD